MTRLAGIAYQVVASVAMLALLLIVGPLCLVTLALTVPPGAEVAGFVFKASVVIVWFGLGYVGIRAWRRKSWWVVTIPIVALPVVSMLILAGNRVVRWYLSVGY